VSAQSSTDDSRTQLTALHAVPERPPTRSGRRPLLFRASPEQARHFAHACDRVVEDW
jgi:hypothetical protein